MNFEMDLGGLEDVLLEEVLWGVEGVISLPFVAFAEVVLLV